MSIKLILDRSVFHGERFKDMAKRLRLLQSKSVISVYATPMLLKETVGLLLKDKRADEAREHLQFILGIPQGKWFGCNFKIFQHELGLMPLRKRYQFLSSKTERLWRQDIKGYIMGLTPNINNSISRDVQENQMRKYNTREIGKYFRSKRPLGLKSVNREKIPEIWEELRNIKLDSFGEGFINYHRYPMWYLKWIALKRWRKNRGRCVYFTDWITGLLYIHFYAMCYSGEIDRNAQADVQNLLYLRDTDGIISEDKRFMKKAWEDLYKPQGKQYLTINELEKL